MSFERQISLATASETSGNSHIDMLREQAGRVSVDGAELANGISAKEAEVTRRQGENNWGLISAVVGQLPTPKDPVFKVTKRWSYNVSGIKRQPEYTVPAESTEESVLDINESTLTELAALRSGVIWIVRSIDDVFDVKVGSSAPYDPYNKATLKEITLPHVLLGAKAGSRGLTDILATPLYGHSQIQKMRAATGYIPSDRLMVSRPVMRNIGVGVASFKYMPRITQFSMKDKAFQSLLALQESMLGRGINGDELAAILNDNKEYVISPTRVACFVASIRRPIPFKFGRHPEQEDDLAHKDFDLKLVSNMAENRVSPEDFKSFKVLDHLERASAILGEREMFTEAVEVWRKERLDDPS